MIESIKSKVKDYGELLYVTKFGSKLYGTDSETSDDDYKAIFLPKKELMLLNRIPNTIVISTGSDKSRNTSSDIDIEIKPLHKFITELTRGDTGAVDLAYSFTNPRTMLVCDKRMNTLFARVNKFYDITNMRAFIGYAQSQALKYSVKGERLSIIKKVYDYLLYHNHEFNNMKLSEFIDELVKECGHDKFCFKKGSSVFILGAEYQSTISFVYFLGCIQKKYEEYGERAKKVAELFEKSDTSADWKALSHALRCTTEVLELIDTGMLHFPLKNAQDIMMVKYGYVGFDFVIDTINHNINLINEKICSGSVTSNIDEEFIDEFILGMYA